MARDRAVFNTAIWNDDDFRALPYQAQHLYFVLWTHPGLSYAGVIDWRPARIAKRAAGWSVQDVERAARCLEARLFVVIDRDTEELLIRSFVRWDGLMKQANLGVSFSAAHAEASSPLIRGVIVHEAKRLREREPGLPSWGRKQVAELLTQTDIDPRSLPVPADPWAAVDPSVDPATDPQVDPSVDPKVEGQPDPATDPGPTPSLSPTPYSLLHTLPDADASSDAQQTSSRRKPERPLPDDWAPNAKHFAQAEKLGVDLMAEARAFRGHAQTHDRRARDWDAAFRTWLDKSRPAARAPQGQQAPKSSWDRVPNITELRLAGKL